MFVLRDLVVHDLGVVEGYVKIYVVQRTQFENKVNKISCTKVSYCAPRDR
jgi:hypothetical protein